MPTTNGIDWGWAACTKCTWDKKCEEHQNWEQPKYRLIEPGSVLPLYMNYADGKFKLLKASWEGGTLDSRQLR